jgi:hypothetical protein
MNASVRRHRIGERVLDLWVEDHGDEYHFKAFNEIGDQVELNESELEYASALVKGQIQ